MLYATERTRIIFITILFILFYVLLIGRLYVLQMVNHDFYVALAEKQYQVTVILPASRGLIFDRHNIPLALNNEAISAFIIPEKINNENRLCHYLKQELPRVYELLQYNKQKKFMYLSRHINDEQKKVFEAFPEVYFLKESARLYLHSSCATVVGLTDVDNQGVSGIELGMQETLAGKATIQQFEKDVKSGFFHSNTIDVQDRYAGQNIHLTIDSTLQFLITKKLKKHCKKNLCSQAGVIVLDPANGDILTMSSYADQAELQMKNNCISNAYEFGSVCKIFAALAAVEEKVVTVDELIDCKNTKTARLDGRTVNTWKAHGLLSFKEVIAKSNNIGIAQVAKRLNLLLYKHYKQLGFAKNLDIPLPLKQRGTITHPANWSKQSLISLSYGYEVSTTLLHLASAFLPIAHDGYKVKPRLLLNVPIKIGKKLYHSETITTIKDILRETTERGTARKARIKGYDVLCKTGSAHLLVDGRYSIDDNLYSCLGMVEKDGYQRVIAVYVQKNGPGQKDTFASTMAAPLFETVAETLLLHDRIL